jgi:TolB-like protein
MRTFSIAAFIVGSISSVVAARAQTVTTQPTASATGEVYLLPFTSVGNDTRFDWAGKAVQQNLLTDLGRSNLHPIAADKVLGVTDARGSAKSVGAKYLITGTYQTSDQLLRFNGQIIEVATGTVLGGITATGAERDLFAMEDELSAQAIQQLERLPGSPQAAHLANTAKPVPPGLQPAVVVQLIQPPAAVAGSSYGGSALEDYVNSNRTPSTDFNQQLEDARDRSTYSPDYGGYYGGYYGTYGLGLYYGGVPFGGYGYSFGYGGQGFGNHSFGNRGFGGRGFNGSGYFSHGAAHGRW